MSEENTNESANFDDVDLNSMKSDEIKALIESRSNPEASEDQPESETEKQESDAEETTTEEVDSSPEEEKEETPAEKESEEEKKPGQFDGKSTDELIKIINDNNAFISRQGNEIGQLRKEIEAIKEEPKKRQQNEEIEKIISEYDPEDRKAVEAIIDRRVAQKEQSRKEQADKLLQTNLESNRIAYSNLISQTEKYSLVKSALDKKFESFGKTERERMENTIEKDPNFVTNAVNEILFNALNSKPSNKKTVTKKVTKTTVNGSGKGSATVPNKKVEDMSSEEYKEFLRKTMPGVVQ